MTTLVDDLVPDELWVLVEPLLPTPPRPPYGGRHRTISNRACFAAIVYMARTSTPWRLLPARELGCGSPATCWRRLTEWANAGVFDQLHLQVLDRLGEQDRVDWERAIVDTMSVRAKRGGDHVGANPVDRGKPGSKLHLVCDGGGLPLTAAVPAANVSDTTMLQPCWMMSRRFGRRRDGGAAGRVRSTATRDTTVQPTVPICGVVGSGRGSPGVGWSRRPGLGGIGGGWSGRCRG
jgi:transposase